MTLHPPKDQFVAGGNIRVADILTSTAKEIDRILGRATHEGVYGHETRTNNLRSLARRLRRLAEAIEKGGA